MILELSPFERFCIWTIFSASHSWGGSEAELLTRAALYDRLGLEEMETVDLALMRKATPSNSQPARYELTPEEAEYLVKAIVVAGSSRDLGRAVARVVRRVRQVLSLKVGA